MSQAHIQGHLVTATFDDSFPNSRISQQLAAMLNIFDSRITLPINANMGSGPLTSVVEFEVDDGLCSTNKHHVKKVTRANKNLPRNALHPQHHPPIRLSPAVIFVVSKLKTSSFRTLQERRASTWRRRYAHARPAPQQWCWTVEETTHPRLQRMRFRQQRSDLAESHIDRQQCTVDAISTRELRWLNEKDRLAFRQIRPNLRYARRMGKVKH